MAGDEDLHKTIQTIAIHSARTTQLLEILLARVDKLEARSEALTVLPVKFENLNDRVKKIEDTQTWLSRGIIGGVAAALAGLISIVPKP